jgi:hypothetical protein
MLKKEIHKHAITRRHMHAHTLTQRNEQSPFVPPPRAPLEGQTAGPWLLKQFNHDSAYFDEGAFSTGFFLTCVSFSVL